MISYLLYTSKSIIRNYQEIDDIVLVAQQFNAEHGITGILLFDDTNFLQVLEGSKQEIESLYNNIKLDSRHDDVRLKIVHNLEERNFPDWSMRIALTTKKSLESIHNMKSTHGEDTEDKMIKILAMLATVLSETFTGYNVDHVNEAKFKQFSSLTSREHLILKLTLKGEAVKTIANELNISPKTVSSHIDNIKIKLNCNTAKDITKKVFDSGYIMYLI